MLPDVVDRFRKTMRGWKVVNTAGTGGTSEPTPVPVPVPTRSNSPFQHEALRVPTVPTVPTQKVGGKRETANLGILTSELASERDWNARPLFDAVALPRDVREVVMSVPGGDDPWRVAGEIITMMREHDAAGHIPPGRSYRFNLTGGGDRGPDPRCDCGEVAAYAISDPRRPRGERWVCWKCFGEWKASAREGILAGDSGAV